MNVEMANYGEIWGIDIITMIFGSLSIYKILYITMI